MNWTSGYRADIDYTYVVDGKQFTNTQMFSAKGEGYDPGTMRKRVDALPGEPDVHYNPQDPSEAYLVLTSSGWVWLSFATAGVLILVGGLLLVVRLLA